MGVQIYYFTCGKCGHTFRNDSLGKHLKSKNPILRMYARKRTKSADAFHEFHESYCAQCVCHSCKPKDYSSAVVVS